jgi:hypothetical protein
MEYTLSFNVFYLKSSGVSQHNNLLGLNEGDYIHLTAAEKAKFDSLPNSFATKTSDLTNDGEDGVNPFITAQDLPAPVDISGKLDKDFSTFTDKSTPIDTDLLPLYDGVNKKLTWANLKVTLKSYFDSIYTTTSAVSSQISTALSGYATESFVISQGYISNVITALGFTPENVANKENTTLDTSATKYPTNRLVKEVVDTKLDKDTTVGVEKVYIKKADGTQGTKATSEFGTTQNYFTFSTNTTLTNSHHNAVIWVTATINITIPSGLRSDFNCTFRTLTGAIATFLTSGTTINAESDGDVQAAKTMSFLAQYTTNNYIISGGGLS